MNKQLSPQDIRDLYEQHRRGLLAYACAFLSSFAAAEDVLHQVFEKLLRGDIHIIGDPPPYLYRSIRNAALNAIRSGSREVELDDGWLDAPAGMEEIAMEVQSV